MRISEIKKNSFLIVFFLFLVNCNYKPLFDKDRGLDFSFKNIEISGNKRISQIVVNKMNIKKDSAGKLDLFVDGKKKISISNKSTSGKVLEYNLTLSFNISIKDNLKGNTVFTKNISETRNYKPSNTYSETVTNEKKIIEDTSDFVAKQIVNEVTLILRNDI